MAKTDRKKLRKGECVKMILCVLMDHSDRHDILATRQLSSLVIRRKKEKKKMNCLSLRDNEWLAITKVKISTEYILDVNDAFRQVRWLIKINT